MNVVYLFMSSGSAPGNVHVRWDKSQPCSQRYLEGMKDEGSFLMLSELKRTGVVDDVTVFYESNRGPGHANWGRGIFGWVCPQIKFVRDFIDDDTVIYVRGGFRGWYDFLTSYKGKNWLIAYNANTGRERWKFWDVILWDLKDACQLDAHGRLWYHYKKPINEDIFKPIDQKLTFDVCIGASHIHDKKGQWRGINALIEYKKKYGKNLNAVLPGWGARGVETSQINSKIGRYGLRVTETGMLSRENLSKTVFNRTKLGLFLGTHGQGDRGPLEALATGMPLIVGSERYHSPSVLSSQVTMMPKNINDFVEIADCIHHCLNDLPSRQTVHRYFVENQGFREVCYPNMKHIFDFIKKHPVPDLKAKKELLNECINSS